LLTGQLLQTTPDWAGSKKASKGEPIWIAEAGFFIDRMPFLSTCNANNPVYKLMTICNWCKLTCELDQFLNTKVSQSVTFKELWDL